MERNDEIKELDTNSHEVFDEELDKGLEDIDAAASDTVLEPEPEDTVFEQPEKKRFEPILTTSARAAEILEENGIIYEGDFKLSHIEFCKLESQQDCLAGTFCIPRLLDILGSKYRIMFVITKSKIVLIDDDEFSSRLIARMNRRKSGRYSTKEKFFYNFIAEFIIRDQELLTQFEKSLMDLEERIRNGHYENGQSELMTLRRKLLTLRGYYDEIMDVGRALEENENGYFAKKHLKYFGTITDRAERLMNKASHLLEYATQVNDIYQAQVDARQNSNMQFLTMISTIFFPLTLITGWYGMNFENMPELRHGYPAVIIVSVIVIIVCIIIFKKKKIL